VRENDMAGGKKRGSGADVQRKKDKKIFSVLCGNALTIEGKCATVEHRSHNEFQDVEHRNAHHIDCRQEIHKS
jgi:hypothetical protein